MIGVGWLAWVLPFFLFKRSSVRPTTIDRRGRVGMLVQAAGYALVWQGQFWIHQAGPWRVAASATCWMLGVWLSWASVPVLGQQWRFDAGLNANHELVRTGPYRFVRHPIYASMLCMLLGMGLLLASWPMLAAAIVVWIIGAEIRVRIEDRLLATRFGHEFEAYRQHVWAYVPFVR